MVICGHYGISSRYRMLIIGLGITVQDDLFIPLSA